MIGQFIVDHPLLSVAIPAILGAIGATGLFLEWVREKH